MPELPSTAYSAENSGTQRLQQCDRLTNVSLLAITILGNLTLDCQRTRIADFLQRPQILLHPDITVTQWNLLAPRRTTNICGRPASILAVYAADIAPTLRNASIGSPVP